MRDAPPPIAAKLHILPRRRSIVFVGSLLVGNIVIFCSSDPLNSSAVIVILGFIVAALNILLAITALLTFAVLISPPLLRYRRRLTILIWIFCTLMLALCSTGQLTVRDVVVVLVVGLLAYFYSLYFKLPLSRKTA